jgi:transposase
MLFLNDQPTASRDEMSYYLSDRYGVVVSNTTISRMLADARWSFKVAKKVARQRNEELRSH